MERLGLLSFQSNDKADIFHVEEVREPGLELSDESWFGVEDPQFESEAAWVTGSIPKINALNVDGDSILLRAWFRGEKFVQPFMLNVYVEYEEAEELIEDDSERSGEASLTEVIL